MMNYERACEVLNQYFEELSADLTGTFDPIPSEENLELSSALTYAHNSLKDMGHNNVLLMAASDVVTPHDNAFSLRKADVCEDLDWFLAFAAA